MANCRSRKLGLDISGNRVLLRFRTVGQWQLGSRVTGLEEKGQTNGACGRNFQGRGVRVR